MSYANCKLGSVQSQDRGWGFNVLRERGGPVVTLTYETEAKAQEAHDLMVKVIAGGRHAPFMNALTRLRRRAGSHAWRANGSRSWAAFVAAEQARTSKVD